MKVRQAIPDWLKGVAIVLMVYGHITYMGSLTPLQNQVHNIIYTFHMPLFLVISGFFFTTKNEPYEAGRRLFSRIVTPYVIFISLYLIGLIVIQRMGITTSNRPPVSFLDFLGVIFFRPQGACFDIFIVFLSNGVMFLATPGRRNSGATHLIRRPEYIFLTPNK